MPDVAGLVDPLRGALAGPSAVVVGALLLLFGRRLYWLLAGVVGFVAVFTLAGGLLPELGSETTLLVSLAAGVAGAVLVVVAHRLLLGLVGAVGGAMIALWQIQQLGFERGPAWLVASLVGGLLGAWLVSRLFEVALALLSSLVGAQLLVERLPVDEEWLLPTYLGLVAFGLVFQLLRSRSRRRRGRRE